MFKSHRFKRCPPLDVDFSEKCLSDMGVKDDDNIVLMTDGGENRESAYFICARKTAGIVQHETVCHNSQQYARSCLVRDVKLRDGTWTYKQGCAGNEKMEGAWTQMCNVGGPITANDRRWSRLVNIATKPGIILGLQ